MPTRTEDELKELRFTRDPSLAGDIADAFGGGGGDATALIQANTLRYPEALTIANDLGWNAPREAELIEAAGGRKAWYAEVADAADMEKIASATLRGEDYVVFQFELPDGRVGKDVMYVDESGALEPAEHADTPERAALRAQVASTRHLRAAKSEADEIVAKAREEAARILAEAAQQSVKDAEDARQKAAEQDNPVDDTEDGGMPNAGGGEQPAITGTGQSAGGKPVASASDVDAMDFDTAKASAERLRLDVTGTGRDGAIKKGDYQTALKKYAEAQGSPQS